MRKIYLLRHAQAASDFSAPDKERELTDLGKEQAFNVGLFLKTQNIDLVLCSAATRTQQTLEQIRKTGAEFNNIEILENFYNAPAENLLDKIENTNKNVLVIAHNPGIHQLAFQLSENSDQALVNKLTMGYPPATLSIFEGNQLIDFITPD